MEWTQEHIESIRHLFPKQRGNVEIGYLRFFQALQYIAKNGCTCRTLVLPGANEMLMGSIPLEDLDALIDPKSQKLIIHPDRPYIAGTKVKYAESSNSEK